MGCGSCSSGGCSIKSGSSKTGSCSGCAGGSCNILSTTDWLGDIMDWVNESHRNLVEVRFKAGRKEFFINKTGKRLYTGDGVMVETGAGYHLGFVSLQGEMAHLQLKKKSPKTGLEELKGIVRLASDRDFERYEEARNRELSSLYRTRQILHELKLPMKLSDVEFQADGTKASFFYSAEERVDFRELIKTLGSEFKVRVDMRQISLRQEAGRLGGIGTCGRELCCSTWLTDFKGVATSAARYQNLSLNPSKLSGQCGRLKCCLNYELDTYLHELKDIPKVDKDLQTLKGYARLQKTDIFRKIMWFAYGGDESNWVKIDIARVNFILEQNKKGVKPQALTEEEETIISDSESEVKNEDLIALDKKFAKKKKKKKPSGSGQPPQNAAARPNPQQRPSPPVNQNPGASNGPSPGGANRNPQQTGRPNQNRRNQGNRPKGPTPDRKPD
jgi:cell fate regulator YaaT (PSP1 superfamily)